MFCPQCGTQAEQQTKFCKSCGLKLAEHGRLLEGASGGDSGNIEQYRREKRMDVGLILTVVSFFIMAFYFLIFGLRAIGYTPEPAKQDMISQFIVFLATSTIPGIIGLILMFASGYFKNIKERRLRTELALLEHKRKALEEASQQLQASFPHEKRDVEASHITEHTTRELQQVAVTSRKISGE